MEPIFWIAIALLLVILAIIPVLLKSYKSYFVFVIGFFKSFFRGRKSIKSFFINRKINKLEKKQNEIFIEKAVKKITLENKAVFMNDDEVQSLELEIKAKNKELDKLNKK